MDYKKNFWDLSIKNGSNFQYLRNSLSDDLHFVTFFFVCVEEGGTGMVKLGRVCVI